MQQLIEGIHLFHQEELGQYKELFHRLSREGQHPHTLFITCSDSRVLAELITHSKPGDLFVVKNIGNIVPASQDGGILNSTAAAVEFAVQALGVSDIVICGHSQCGAMTALLEGSQKQKALMPHLSDWLDVASPVKQLIDKNYQHLTRFEDRINAAALENVLFALENLRTYPIVQSHLASGKLRLHGWFFKISTAEIFAYDPSQHQFQLIKLQND